MFKKSPLFLIIVLLLVLAACSSENKKIDTHQENSQGQVEEETKTDDSTHQVNESTKNKPQKKQNNDWKKALAAKEVPDTIKEIVSQPAGELVALDVMHNEKDKQKAVQFFSKLPRLGENASKAKVKAYWQKMHTVFHGDYPGTDQILKELKYAAFGRPDIKDNRFQFKKHLNVEVVLDASGSMGGMIGAQTKMEIAKETIQSFASSLPEEARVALRVYGQKGTGAESDKKMSCNSSKLVYSLKPYQTGKFSESLNQFDPAGWTPIALALKKAKQDFSKYPAKSNTNIIYLVSDGIATCGGNPVQAAKTLADSNVNPIVNIIGFDIDNEGQQQLKKVATAAEGIYTTVEDQDQLKKQLDKAQSIAEKWAEWKNQASQKTESQQNDNYFDILGFALKWGDIYQRENHNIWYTSSALNEKGYISDEAYSQLSKFREDQVHMLIKFTDVIEERLHNINKQNYQKTKAAIEKLYQQNTK